MSNIHLDTIQDAFQKRILYFFKIVALPKVELHNLFQNPPVPNRPVSNSACPGSTRRNLVRGETLFPVLVKPKKRPDPNWLEPTWPKTYLREIVYWSIETMTCSKSTRDSIGNFLWEPEWQISCSEVTNLRTTFGKSCESRDDHFTVSFRSPTNQKKRLFHLRHLRQLPTQIWPDPEISLIEKILINSILDFVAENVCINIISNILQLLSH